MLTEFSYEKLVGIQEVARKAAFALESKSLTFSQAHIRMNRAIEQLNNIAIRKKLGEEWVKSHPIIIYYMLYCYKLNDLLDQKAFDYFKKAREDVLYLAVKGETN